jgi:hypothetical protein
MQRTLDLHYDKLIIGADLSALCFSYIHKIPLIYLRKDQPYKYNLSNDYEEQKKVYEDLLFLLSITNYVPFSNLVKAIRIQDNNNLKIISKNNLVCNISFNKLYISDDYEITGLPTVISKTTKQNCVIDWFDAVRGCTHDLEIIKNDNDYVKFIHFYITSRILFNKSKRDCLSVSVIDDENLNLFEYSQTSIGFETVRLMKNAGIKGKWDKTNNKHKSLKLVSRKREIHPLGKNIYQDLPSNISMLYSSYEEILKQPRTQDEYLEMVAEKYGIIR